MALEKKHIKVMGLAMSLPTSAFAVIWGVMELADQGVFPRWVALMIIMSCLFNFFVLMIWHAKKSKKKPLRRAPPKENEKNTDLKSEN